MKFKLVVMATFACISICCTESQAHDLLGRLMARGGCGCQATDCGGCEEAPVADCGCESDCGSGCGLLSRLGHRERCGGFGVLRGRLSGCGCETEACGPTCPEDACGNTGGLLGRLRGCGCEAPVAGCGCGGGHIRGLLSRMGNVGCGCNEAPADDCGCHHRQPVRGLLSKFRGHGCGCEAAPADDCGCRRQPVRNVLSRVRVRGGYGSDCGGGCDTGLWVAVAEKRLSQRWLQHLKHLPKLSQLKKVRSMPQKGKEMQLTLLKSIPASSSLAVTK